MKILQTETTKEIIERIKYNLLDHVEKPLTMSLTLALVKDCDDLLSRNP